jgi:hypothetical protein
MAHLVDHGVGPQPDDFVAAMIPTCPAPRNAGHRVDLFLEWTPNEARRRRILVINPARLYGVPD